MGISAPPIAVNLLLKMIAELGHDLKMCDRVSTPADPDLAIPAGFSFSNFRSIRGYVVQQRATEIATTGGLIQSSDLMAYVAEPSLEIDSNTYLVYGSTYYQIESQEPILQYGKPVLRRVKLTQNKSGQAIAQPDPIINFPQTI